MSFSICFYCNAYVFFFPYLVNSAVSYACSNLSRCGENVCFLSRYQGAIISRLQEQSFWQNLFALVAVGGKRVGDQMGFSIRMCRTGRRTLGVSTAK